MLYIVKWTVSLPQCDQGIKNLSAAKAGELASGDPDYAIRDLHNSIASGNYPSWSLKIQVMTYEQAEKFKWNPFDLTKVRLIVYVLKGKYPLSKCL